ncbi:MAG: hypothetical protein EIB84_06615 [Spiroplasma poulsonii]|uniref:hypothetical protein n=2 Tax=Spiroplasma poulsonii TaxID=2138 RepID=UPI000589CB5B|nr:hypothetical protein [Spiroplasma poulsonii]MBW1242425.1 hypothetical protein [Spiroplasma poulsonii]
MAAKTSPWRTHQGNQITMKKVENKDTKNHNLMIVDVDLQKCLNCSFTIQKVDDEWFTINTGNKNCGKK